MTTPIYPIAAIRDDGTTILARTPEEALAFHRLHVWEKHVHAYIGMDGWLRSERHEWIMRDDHGCVLLAEDLPERPRRHIGWYERNLRRIRHAAERGLPIPLGEKRIDRARNRRAFRMNVAMRGADLALDADLAEWGVDHMQVGRMRTRKLPQVGDDIAWREPRRCWKRYRDSQWRQRPETEGQDMSGNQEI